MSHNAEIVSILVLFQKIHFFLCNQSELTYYNPNIHLTFFHYLSFLPVYRPLISYLSKFYYYDPEEEMYLSIKRIRRVVDAEQEAESQT